MLVAGSATLSMLLAAKSQAITDSLLKETEDYITGRFG